MSEKRRALEINRAISGAIRKHYSDVQTRSRPVAWQTMSPNPLTEISYAAGIQPCFPENYACVSASRHASARYCEAAESYNYSQDICSYVRNTFGYIFARGDDPPMGGMHEPDLLMLTLCSCVTYFKWWSLLGSIYNKPLITVDVPRIMDKVEDYYIGYVVGELERAIVDIEKVTGTKVTQERLTEVVRLSDELIGYWQGICQMQKAVPVPSGLNDLSNILFLLVALPGTQEAVDIIKQAYDEVKQRAEAKMGVVPEEKHRLFYLNIPLWYDLQLISYFEDRGAVFPISDYTHYTWGTVRMDASKPLESLAVKALHGELNESVDKYINNMLRDIKEYSIDGVVIHSNRSCKILSMGALDAASVIRETCNIPVLILEADHTDERVYSEKTIKGRVDSFLEMLG